MYCALIKYASTHQRFRLHKSTVDSSLVMELLHVTTQTTSQQRLKETAVVSVRHLRIQ